MLPMPLPETHPSAASEWKDSAACKQWLWELPLTNSGQAQQALTEELKRFLCVDMAPLERLKILEQLRDTVAGVQEECAKKYAGKPLPLLATEITPWKQSLELWQTLRATYQRCLLDTLSGSGEAAKYSALICQRCLRYTALTLCEYYLTNQEADPELWHHLHALYVLAEKHNLTDEAVRDSLIKEVKTTTCTVAYVQALLLCQSCPYSLTPKQLELASRWVDKWGAKIQIGPSPGETPHVLAVDLDSNSGATQAREIAAAPSVRYLITDDLGNSLMKRIVRLERGQAPAELGLGEDCLQPGCETLIKLLYQQWCRAGSGRTAPRREAEQKVQICFGIPATHYFISGKPFKQPGASHQLSRQEEEELRTFGHVSKHREAMELSQQGFALEFWKIIDDSSMGLGLMREADAGGSRASLNQLIGVCPAGGKNFMLCIVKWITLRQNGELHIGVRALPGIPEPVAARASGLGTAPAYAQAFLLPDVAALKTEPSIVLPNGWFHTGRIIDVFTSESQRIKLTKLLEKGIDYERIDFGAP
jgi:hypothetical protein